MSEASFFTQRPRRKGAKGIGKALFAVLRICQVVISPITKPLASAAGVRRARKFHQNVLTQMSLTIANLHPDTMIGARDRKGWYTEIDLTFRDFRIRITRAIYNRRHQDFWADIGSTSDPAALFRIDYVIEALRRLDNSSNVSALPRCRPETLAELDATIWAAHEKLAEHLSTARYIETKSMIQKVMHE